MWAIIHTDCSFQGGRLLSGAWEAGLVTLGELFASGSSASCLPTSPEHIFEPVPRLPLQDSYPGPLHEAGLDARAPPMAAHAAPPGEPHALICTLTVSATHGMPRHRGPGTRLPMGTVFAELGILLVLSLNSSLAHVPSRLPTSLLLTRPQSVLWRQKLVSQRLGPDFSFTD